VGMQKRVFQHLLMYSRLCCAVLFLTLAGLCCAVLRCAVLCCAVRGYVCVCGFVCQRAWLQGVCVCVCERERERESARACVCVCMEAVVICACVCVCEQCGCSHIKICDSMAHVDFYHFARPFYIVPLLQRPLHTKCNGAGFTCETYSYNSPFRFTCSIHNYSISNKHYHGRRLQSFHGTSNARPQ
jgi:hypothetical protein